MAHFMGADMYVNYFTNQSSPGGNWKLEQYYLFNIKFRISNQMSNNFLVPACAHSGLPEHLTKQLYPHTIC